MLQTRIVEEKQEAEETRREWRNGLSSEIPGRKHRPDHLWQSPGIQDMHGHLLSVINFIGQHSFYHQEADSLQKTISECHDLLKACPSPKFTRLCFSFPLENCECQLFSSLKTIIKLVGNLVNSNSSLAS